MSLSLRLTLLFIAAAGCAFAQGNPCEDPVGTGGGCRLPISVQHGGLGTDGAFDLTGTQFQITGTADATGDSQCVVVGTL